MAQITLYVPDDIAERIRREAKRAGKSLSAYVTDLATGGAARAGWPSGFAKLYGSCDLPLPRRGDDPPPDEPDAL